MEVFLPGVVLFFAPPAFAFDELAEVMLGDGFDFESPVAGVARALEADFFGDDCRAEINDLEQARKQTNKGFLCNGMESERLINQIACLIV